MRNCRMNILVGGNASGKTHYLVNKIQNNNRKDVVTNLVDLDMLGSFDIDDERIAVIGETLEADNLLVNSSMLYIADGRQEFSKKLCELLFLLCIKRGILILDEPDADLSYSDDCAFHAVISQIRRFYDEIWISSHNEGVLSYPSVNFFKVVENGDNLNLIDVSEESVDELRGML